MAPEFFHIGAILNKFHAKRGYSDATAFAGDGENRGETVFHQHLRFTFDSAQPAELDLPFISVHFVDNLLRGAQLFVARHMMDGGAKVSWKERQWTWDGSAPIESDYQEVEANGGVFTHLSNRPPRAKSSSVVTRIRFCSKRSYGRRAARRTAGTLTPCSSRRTRRLAATRKYRSTATTPARTPCQWQNEI